MGTGPVRLRAATAAQGLVMTKARLIFAACVAAITVSGGMPVMAQEAPPSPLDEIFEVMSACRTWAEEGLEVKEKSAIADGFSLTYFIEEEDGSERDVTRDQFLDIVTSTCVENTLSLLVDPYEEDIPVEFTVDIEQS